MLKHDQVCSTYILREQAIQDVLGVRREHGKHPYLVVCYHLQLLKLRFIPHLKWINPGKHLVYYEAL